MRLDRFALPCLLTALAAPALGEGLQGSLSIEPQAPLAEPGRPSLTVPQDGPLLRFDLPIREGGLGRIRDADLTGTGTAPTAPGGRPSPAETDSYFASREFKDLSGPHSTRGHQGTSEKLRGLGQAAGAAAALRFGNWAIGGGL